MSIEEKTAVEVIVSALREDILSGRLRSGEPLRQDELASRFGTSRIPVREALRRLEAEHFVSALAQRGARVSALTLAQAMERMDIRIGLECRALRLAVPNMTELDFRQLNNILDEYDQCEGPAGWAKLNWDFHTYLYLPADRPLLLQLIQTNMAHVGRFIRETVSAESGKDRPQNEHRELLDACKAGNAELAVQLLEAHISYAQKYVAAAVRQTSQS